MRMQARALVLGLLHLLGIGRDPQRAAVGESRAGRLGGHAWRPGVPLGERGLADGQLGGVVVHDHQVAHAGVGGTAQACVEHQNGLARIGQRMGTRCADDAGADDDDVRFAHAALELNAPAKGVVRLNQ